MSRRPGILGVFAALTSAQLVSTGAGFAFWLVAARLVAPGQLGIAAAGLAAVTLLSKLTSLGLGTLLVVELPRYERGDALRMLRTAVLLLVAVGVLAGLVCVLGAGLLPGAADGPLERVLADPWLGILFVLVAGLTTATSVSDQAVLGIGRAGTQVTRNAVASIGRFPVLLVLALAGDVGARGLLVAWLVPLALSLVVTLVQVRPPRSEPGSAHLGTLLRYWRSALAHHALGLALAAGPLVVPVIAGALLTPVDNAHFTISWMVATFVFIPPYMLATALFASTASQGMARFATSMRRTLPLSLGLSAALWLGALLGGDLVARAFGSSYGENSGHLLGLLALGGLWMVVKDHLVAQYRVQGRLGFATGLAVVSVALEAGGAALGGHLGGAEGIALGWLAAAGAQAVLGAPVVLDLVRTARRAQPAIAAVEPGAEPLVVTGPVPLRTLLGVLGDRPSEVVVTGGGPAGAWLLGLVAWRRVQLVSPRPGLPWFTRGLLRLVPEGVSG